MRISAHVVLSGVKPREFEVAVRIGTRGVWIQTVGGLDRYTCIGDGLPVFVENTAGKSSQPSGKLSVRSRGKCQHGNDTENQKSSSH